MFVLLPFQLSSLLVMLRPSSPHVLSYGYICVHWRALYFDAVNRISEESTVNRYLSGNTEEELTKLVGWAGLDNPWLPETDSNVEYSYINLQVNPERYTGYSVRFCSFSAGHVRLTRQIWQARHRVQLCMSHA
jgi:hypothetical protein